jgi:hypothetical protein
MDNYSIDVIETVLTNNIDTKYYYAGGCAGFMFNCHILKWRGEIATTSQ